MCCLATQWCMRFNEQCGVGLRSLWTLVHKMFGATTLMAFHDLSILAPGIASSALALTGRLAPIAAFGHGEH